MELGSLSLVAAAGIGFIHAFEADHLAAMTSLVAGRNTLIKAMKDGVYWGLGHTSTLLLIGAGILLGRFIIQPSVFQYMEAGVGVMLLGLGIWRMYQWWSRRNGHSEKHTHSHHLSYAIGLMHGIAGSGVLALAIMSSMHSTGEGLAFLVIFGLGSTIGMLVAGSLLSIPLLQRFSEHRFFSNALSLLSVLLCWWVGTSLLLENLLPF